MKKQIGFDFDDVLMDTRTALRKFHNARYGTSYKKEDEIVYELEPVWKCSHEEAVRRVLEFYETGDHDGTVPMPGAYEHLKNLKEKYDLHIVTARPDIAKERTLRLIDLNFPEIFTDIIFVNYFHGGNKRSKSDACNELGVKTFVEDSLEHARDLLSSGIDVLLYDAPWNREHLPSAKRVFSWQEIGKELL